MSDSYIGARAQINTKSKFTYDGVIGAINATDQTITLTSVKVVSTPGGPSSGDTAIKTYASVTFKGADVEDLQVFEPAEAAARPQDIEDKQSMDDPAIVSVVERNASHADHDWLEPQFPNGPYDRSRKPSSAPYGFESHHAAGTGRKPVDVSPAEIEAQTQQFQQEKQDAWSAMGPVPTSYNPTKSFFDSLGGGGGGEREDFRRERSVNMETFGESPRGPSYNRGGGYRRGGGSRGRGNRGGQYRRDNTL